MRLFLGLELPESLRRAAAAAVRRLRLDERAWRVAREDGLHITLRFLGEVDAARRRELDEAWRRAAGGTGAIPLTLGSAGAFPGARRPRVIWLGIADRSAGGALSGLAARLEEAAAALGFPAETRPFTPHVTLARARALARVPPLDLPAIEVLGDFVARRLVLFRSVPGAGGTTYVEEAAFALVEGPDA